MSRAPVIVAVGARTPVGLLAETSAAAVRAGISRIAEHPRFVGRRGEPIRGCLDARLDPALEGPQRLLALGRSALAEVGAKLRAAVPITQPLLVLLATPQVRPGWTAADENIVARELARNPAVGDAGLDVRVVGHGHAGALHALGMACERIAAGVLDLCIVGGLESYFFGPTLHWLDKQRQLAGASATGFFPGEGAAFLAVASPAAARALQLRPKAELRGWSSAMERRPIKTDLDNLGEGLAQAVLGATRGLRAPHEKIDDIYCDINGERYRSEEWAFATMRVHPVLVDGTRYVAATDSWGDTGAATGALLCILAVQAWARGYARGSLAMAWAGSENGQRSAVVMQRPSA